MDTASIIQSSVEWHIREEVGNLHDDARKAQAMAGLCILLTQLQEASVPDELIGAIPTFLAMLDDSGDRGMQANACAVLSGLMAISDELQKRIVDDGLVRRLQQLLTAVSDTEERTLQLNALACLAEALRDREGEAEALTAGGGLAPVLRLCDTSMPVRLQEAAADVLCAVACAENTRAGLSEQGAVEKLASLLATPNHDVRVRSLMGLGMLLSKSNDNQLLVARNAVAVSNLLAIMKQKEDQDCRIVARDIFSGLVSAILGAPLADILLSLDSSFATRL
ncbi:hypothetical protein VOLCADRAFT_121421 [Volvox carteri f. nagariensis]|uniref:Uncharacterized protein n=1 Tax=Volvox carteri f. nagariensis TaxID=3068 RepID=D8U9Q7_VOLCA|nr:uncharacterized protein VOLCADRAFT_121421 [Volvox carteri f. nagariensis]EFJ43516.1 hypothetical protein VOLCADRAFT_121421 [Volvox carteri f. nagariensis]|eukprot:XP_002955445.1 hypothetical protein VOLCADRAFT_121421 [Volvox carteri f. nagariensis]